MNSSIPTVSLVLLTLLAMAQGRVIYVDDDATGGNDGTSWGDAYVHLQDALGDAGGSQEAAEIRVAQGIYKPDRGAGQTSGDREATFSLRSGLSLQGGYAGIGQPDPDARDRLEYRTILSGDLNDDDDLSQFEDIASCWSTLAGFREPACDAFDADGDGVLTYQDLRESLANVLQYSDNAYSVVTARAVDNTGVLDGFFVTSGNSCKPEVVGQPPHNIGAGLHMESAFLLVRDCTFTANVAGYDGGGLRSLNSSPTISNCRFEDNLARHDGGAIGHEYGSPIIEGCSIVGNYAGDDAGGVYLSHDGVPQVRDSRIEGNRAFQDGGGLYCSKGCAPEIAGTMIASNVAFNGGGIGCRKLAAPTIVDNAFTGNMAWDDGGAIYLRCSGAIVTNNVLRSNFAVDDGGGIYSRIDGPWQVAVPEMIFTGNVIVANVALDNGGGIYVQNVSPEIANSVLALNYAEDGGAFWCRTKPYEQSTEAPSCAPVLRNVTISGNACTEDGSAICCRWGATPSLFDSIAWAGADSPGYSMMAVLDDAQLTIESSCVQGGWPGQGNLDADPLFVDAGYRDLNGTPDDPTDDLWAQGDYHLKSRVGRWDSATGAWIADDFTSPCVDAGDAGTPVGSEPAPNGGVVNLGAYGGTAEASHSPPRVPVTEDFETGTFSSLPWTFEGDAFWWVVGSARHAGRFSARAGDMEDNQTATFATTVHCTQGDMSFFVRVSSERDYDRLVFRIDGVPMAEWSGQQDWTQASFPVSVGMHTFEWSYVKDWSVSAGSDTAWVDDILIWLW